MNAEGQMVVDSAVVNIFFQKREDHRVTLQCMARQHMNVVCRMILVVRKMKRGPSDGS